MGKQIKKGRSALNRRVLHFTTLALGTTALCAGVAQAQSNDSNSDQGMQLLTFAQQFKKQVVEGSTLHGFVGFYDFRRWHDSNGPNPYKKNDAYGANAIMKTGSIYGFSGGLEVTFAKSFYGNGLGSDANTANLPYGGEQITLPQAYLQYNNFGFQVRGGRQILNTPLAAGDQYVFAPRSFNGVTLTWQPLATKAMMHQMHNSATNSVANQPPSLTQNANYETNQYLPFNMGAKATGKPTWQLFGAYINGYESRNAGKSNRSGKRNSFGPNNRYFTDVGGFYAMGTTYRNTTSSGQFVGQYFHYHFDKTETADYIEGGYMTPKMSGGFAPYIRAQAIAAYNGNKARISQGINSQIYGLKLGVMTDQLNFSIFGDYSPVNNGSFNHGQMLKPYTDLSGVIYTDTMNDGVQNFGPGYGLGTKLSFTPTDNLSVYARYVYYRAKYGHGHNFYFGGSTSNPLNSSTFTQPLVKNQKSQGIGIGMTYNMGGVWNQLAGLTIGDNLGITKINGYPDFYDNRVRLRYNF